MPKRRLAASIKTKIMNNKVHYNAPETEVVTISMERGFLTLSDGNGSQQAQNVQNLGSEDIYSGDCSW